MIHFFVKDKFDEKSYHNNSEKTMCYKTFFVFLQSHTTQDKLHYFTLKQ